MSDKNDWWRAGVLYQVYLRSFQDSDGDGIGDLRGLTRRLPHIAALGADGLWVSPFFKSPMRDFGYDVSDYREVDPVFGTLADFDTMLATAHQLGLRVLLDLVLSHTSMDHPWFVASRSSRDNPCADWYVWADPQRDGSPPNNWLSLFGGSAWHWDTRRQQYYLHNFLSSQPDLNFHNPDVQQAVLDIAEFWLQRGVDGFRLDVVNFYFHDRHLRSNPPQEPGQWAAGVPASNPYARQSHLFDKTRPENLAFIERLRKLMDRYPGTTTMGEIGDDQQYKTLAEYTTPRRLHMAYTFNLLGQDCAPPFIHGQIDEFLAQAGASWACWSLGNHDVERVLTRWSPLGEAGALGPVLMALLGSLRGTPCIYQGEELGLGQASLPYVALRDPYGKEMWPEFPGRDGCRTPLPWQHDSAHGGFSEGEPWLPVDARHLPLAVDLQERDAHSPMQRYRRFLHWRRNQPLLRSGQMSMLPAHPAVIAFVRYDESPGGTRRMLCAFNLSSEAADYEIPSAWELELVGGHGFDGGASQGHRITLPAHHALFALCHAVSVNEPRSTQTCPASNSEPSTSASASATSCVTST